MVKSDNLLKFEKYADLFLEFEKEFSEPQDMDRTSFTVELEREEFKALWEKVKGSYENFATASGSSDSEDEFIAAKMLFKNCRQAYITCAAIMGELSQTFVNRPIISSTHSVPNINEASIVGGHHLRLPPCTTEPFYGDYQSWPAFRDMFVAVYMNCTSLTSVEKLFYLRQNTRDEALEIVKKSPLTNDGFETAWKNLKDRYENKRILVNIQLKTLFNLVEVESESAAEIKRLQRDINNCISALYLHEIDIANWDSIFIFLCSIKLPDLTLSAWEHSLGDKTEIPKWEDMDKFLTSRFQSLETVSGIRANPLELVSTPRSSKTNWNIRTDHRQQNARNQLFGKNVRTYQAKVVNKTCPSCSKDHLLYNCPKFLGLNPGERFVVVKRHNLCINCLSGGHKLSTCQSNFSCSMCKLKHHTLLHREVVDAVISQVDGPSTSQAISRNSTVQNCFATTSRQILLGTAVVTIKYRGEVFLARAIIDSGSQATFISESLQNKLNLAVRRITAQVSGLNGASAGSVQKLCSFDLSSPLDSRVNINVECLVLPKLTGNLPTQSVTVPLSSLGGLKLADPNFAKSGKIDLLIGADIYGKIMKDGVKRNVLGGLIAQETIFGWILIGALSDSVQGTYTTSVSFYTEVGLDKQLEKFWALEEPPRASKASPEDEFCEEHYLNTTRRNQEGRYIVSLPFKPQYSGGSGLGSSREKAQRQFLRNEMTLLKRPDIKSTYDSVLSEYETLNHMALVEKNDLESSHSFYLPHHAVFKPESTSTKVRVVFNASSRSSSGFSLNDILYTGPVLQSDLMMLIIRWRFYRYVFNGDIEKMYRQILVEPKQTKYQRIVFRRNPNDDLAHYELKTVTFGVNCAPYLAIRTLFQLAGDVEGQWPLASKILRQMMYVDDALAGAHDISGAIAARNELLLALSSAGFCMRKWTSNDQRILQDLPTDFLLKQKFLEIDGDSTTKTLGIRWNAASDIFYFSTSLTPAKDNSTKREVLSMIAKLFDPAGWLGPIVIVAKMLMQQIWSEKTDWDEVISESSLQKWKQFLSDYRGIDDITIPRWVGFSLTSSVQIHGFSDASEKAYGACVYARLQDNQCVIQSHLLIAKSRVAPIKTVSLPRLELCGAYLLSDLMDSVRNDFEFDEERTKAYAWTDSMIVLAWLQKPPNTWKTFVANRVSKILEKTDKNSWGHVGSNENPADLISRGMRPQDLIDNKLWWHGPEWLCLSSERWESVSVSDCATKEEERKPQVLFTYFEPFDDLLNRFSSYSRALRVMALVMRTCKLILKQEEYLPGSEITSKEIQAVKEKLIIVSQKAYFGNEYHKLINDQAILEGKLLNLSPFLDDKGIIRVGGRLANASHLTYNEKFPIVLHSSCHFAILFVEFVHQITLHGGNQLMLRVLRTEFFIPRAKNLIKTVIGRCKSCVLQKKATQSQIMAALPTSRTVISRPFTTAGVDFTGPFDIRNYTGRACLITKGYVCLFVCFATKAIHMEAVSNLSTPAFLAAFERFVSRRGYPKEMHSDNGTNFVGASKLIKSEFRAFLRNTGSTVNAKYGPHGLQWHFNPAGAPHMGGLWEAGVKSFKHHFKRIAGNLKYTFEEFSTLLARIECCLNSRPLCPLADNIESLDILTPGHFLIGGPLLAPPEIENPEAPLSITNRWQRVKALNQRLCARWKDDYLKDLHKRNKWKFIKKDLEIGDLVVIREDNLPTNEWRMGRVVKLHLGKDGHVRVVDLKTTRGLISRPVVKYINNTMVSPKKYADDHRAGKKMVCRVCLKSHPLRFCTKFLQVDIEERMQLVSIYKYCASCLSHDQTWRTCESKGKCKRCGDMHHTLLHKRSIRPSSSSSKKHKKPKRCQRGPSSSNRPKSRGPRSSQNSASASNGQEDERPSSSRALVPAYSRNNNVANRRLEVSRRKNDIANLPSYQILENVFLKPTAIVKIVSKDKYIFERALIDPGAESSIVSDEVVRRLGAKTVRVGQTEKFLFVLRGNHGNSETVETYATVKRRFKMTTPSKSVDGRIADEFPGFQLADPQFYISAPVQIKLGCDVYTKIVRNGVSGGSFGKPLAQFSIFGYLISGSCAP